MCPKRPHSTNACQCAGEQPGPVSAAAPASASRALRGGQKARRRRERRGGRRAGAGRGMEPVAGERVGRAQGPGLVSRPRRNLAPVSILGPEMSCPRFSSPRFSLLSPAFLSPFFSFVPAIMSPEWALRVAIGRAAGRGGQLHLGRPSVSPGVCFPVVCLPVQSRLIAKRGIECPLSPNQSPL